MDVKIVLFLLFCVVQKIAAICGSINGSFVYNFTFAPGNPKILRYVYEGCDRNNCGMRFNDTAVANGQLRCYACGFSSVDSDRSCLTITDDTPIVDCSYTYCTILRQEFQDPIGVVASFTRGCEEAPDYLNHEIVDPTFTTYYRACTSDLCNIGDGVQSVTGGSLSPTPEYNGINLLVPGTGNGVNIKNNLALFTIMFFVLLLV